MNKFNKITTQVFLYLLPFAIRMAKVLTKIFWKHASGTNFLQNVVIEADKKIPNGVHQKMQKEDIDFSLWEDLYKRSLSEAEKLEIKTNLLNFSKIIIAEDLRQKEDVLLQELEEI